MVREANRQIAEAEERERRRRESEKAKMAALKNENDVFLEGKAREKRSEAARDAALAREYMALEAAKEAARVAWLAEQSERIQAKMRIGARVIEKQSNSLAEEEGRIQRIAEEYVHRACSVVIAV